MQTPNGESLTDFIKQHGAEQLALSLQELHDWILYDSELTVDQHWKDILHDVHILIQKLKEFNKKDEKQ